MPSKTLTGKSISLVPKVVNNQRNVQLKITGTKSGVTKIIDVVIKPKT
tara:strand:+ start:184 stop:327 length:144 start_codon:yes stop_codon:yes gene_type:complete